ncbi:MAG: bifunctional response regulator/alkaline phosphatase family protein [Bacteroidales bacterium]|nr:bifunctional response regulator/alkaline phosphatase family protein [Bacteroidales bacterium]
MGKKISILWADDEIDLLKPHILFLEEKGYQVSEANNGDDAIEAVEREEFDIIFLDENMPGLTGLQVLAKIKTIRAHIPVVMITKSEEEAIMDEAIGSKIADYLIKPVNPNQILLTIKKNVDTKRLISEKTTSAYQHEFSKIAMQMNDRLHWSEWIDLYRKLIYWELELVGSGENTMDEVFQMQKREANMNFARYIRNEYSGWFSADVGERPLISPDIFKHRVFPTLKEDKPVVVIIVDNLRYDQWKLIEGLIQEDYTVNEELYFSILPTATQYARNAMFAGLMPLEISKMYPELWVHDHEDTGKNIHELRLLNLQLERAGMSKKVYYDKINNNRSGKKIAENPAFLLKHDLSVLVFNFVDILSHSRTEMNMIKELTDDEAAYRSLTLSWFQHSPLLDLFRVLATRDVKVVLTTDHGTTRVQSPVKVIGDKFTTTNLRYKQGKNLSYNPKDVFEVTNPADIHLPSSNVSSRYIFAQSDDFFAYPNNYNHYVKYYRDTFQHGGVSLDEMIIPVIELDPKT